MSETPQKIPSPRGRYVGFGWVLQDQVMCVERYPDEDTKQAAIGEPLAQSGGPSIRALMVLNKCGSDAVALGAVGSDSAGREVLTELALLGVDTDGLVVADDRRTRQAHVWLAGGERGSRTIVYSTVGPELDPGDIDFGEWLAGSSALLLDGRHPELALEAARAANNCGVLVALDLGGPKDRLRDLADLADILVGPRATWGAIGFTQMSESGGLFKAYPNKVCVATAGTGEVCAFWKGRSASFQPPKVEVVDSNGAGDVFFGLTVWSITHGLSLQPAVELAAVGASIKCESLGNAGVPHLDQIVRRWESLGTPASADFTQPW